MGEGGATRTLHGWLYALMEELCFDREYLYLAFVEHFTGFMKEVLRTGGSSGIGEYPLPGIKSGRRAILKWALEKQLTFMGPNILSITVEADWSGAPGEREVLRFDLSTGAAV